ncbi:DNA-primase RepB domain-containing protein [candidate division CSSED10-310 bacterium]|uniref:DNA-primase RepB domain-containing protein n=1 Tax=candidate division CSSED10-310 bacterium TaxID=2855610 RepID=A0ABV6Z5Q7_UNCC1
MKNIFDKCRRYFMNWSLGVLDETKGRWTVAARPSIIPYLRAMNSHGCHILLRPQDHREPYYLLCDDLSWDDLQRDHQQAGIWKPGRLIVETSPDNFQVWIHSRHPLSDDEKLYWLGRLGSDPSCSPRHRWGRCPGFRNRKECYNNDGIYPLAKLIWIDYARTAAIPCTQPLQQQRIRGRKSSPFPSTPRGLCARTLSRLDYDKGNESTTDFAYTLALLRRNVSPKEVKMRLLAERKDWTHHPGGKKQETYIERTINRASQLVGRRS